MKRKIHGLAGALALLTILTFWISTVVAELIGSVDQIIFVKTAILYGMAVLIPALAATGASGFSLAAKWKNPTLARKKQRMRIAAANGLLVLLPSAIFLYTRAQAANFDTWFVTIQIIEVAAGAANILALSLNMKDGIALHNRRNKSRLAVTAS